MLIKKTGNRGEFSAFWQQRILSDRVRDAWILLVMIPELRITIICIHTIQESGAPPEPLWSVSSGILAEWEGPMQLAWYLNPCILREDQNDYSIKVETHTQEPHVGKEPTTLSSKEQRRFMKTIELDCFLRAWTEATMTQKIPVLSGQHR